jgi:hypothetical protein
MLRAVQFRKRLVEALWYVWVLSILEFIDALHRAAPASTILHRC